VVEHKATRYATVRADVVTALHGDGTGLAVYVVVALHAGETGEAWPHQSTIAAILGVSEPTVRRALRRLIAVGIIDRSARVDAHGRKLGNVYRIIPPDRSSVIVPGPADRSPARAADRSPARDPRARDLLPEGNIPTMNKDLDHPPAESADLVLVGPVDVGKIVDVPSTVERVFDEWRRVTGRTGRTILTPNRERLIRARIKDGYHLDDLLDAVRGWRRSPFHSGRNQSRTVYNDLELLLRSPENVERFRDLERQTGAAVIPMVPDPAMEAVERQRQIEGRS